MARTHALGLNGLALVLGLVIAWRLLAAGALTGTIGAFRETWRWRT